MRSSASPKHWTMFEMTIPINIYTYIYIFIYIYNHQRFKEGERTFWYGPLKNGLKGVVIIYTRLKIIRRFFCWIKKLSKILIPRGTTWLVVGLPSPLKNDGLRQLG